MNIRGFLFCVAVLLFLADITLSCCVEHMVHYSYAVQPSADIVQYSFVAMPYSACLGVGDLYGLCLLPALLRVDLLC